jgi:tetratricopeptide (TPR) repeat protein
MTRTLKVFISSKMVELRDERKALEKLLPTLGDDTIQLSPWVFETDAPASGKSIRSVYLDALDQSDLYIGIFWNEFGEWTVDEFYRAGEQGITRHIYVKNLTPEQRDPRLIDFLKKQSDVRFGVTPRWFQTVDDLLIQVSKSVRQWLLEQQTAHHSATSAILIQSPDDIPDLPRNLIGRDDLIAEVSELLDDNERVLLRGFGGTGKTALAATLAADRLEAGKGSVIWVRAGAADADAIFEAIGRALGEQQAIASTEGDERVAAIRHLLSDRQAILVLDDAWNGQALAQVVKAIPRRLPLLVTSRQRFPLDEIVEVGELKPADALRLLEYHVRRRDLGSDPQAAQLCGILGHHAFALEIAGRMMKVHDLSPAELVQRIQDTPHDLNMPAGYGELGRTGIKALMDTSVDALSQDLHDVFLTMGGMFEPSASPELVARVMRRSPDKVGDDLEGLEARGLVRQQTLNEITYYRLHDLAYSYARNMFINKGLSQQPVIDACRDFTQAHIEDLDALDVEQSNILEAAEAAHETGHDEILVEIITMLSVDGPFFEARGHTSKTIQLLRTAIDAALQAQDIETAHYLLGKLGNTYTDFTGDLDLAWEAYQHSLELARQMGNTRREAMLLTVLGKVRVLQKMTDSDDYYAQAEQIARRSQDDFALCFVLHHRGFQLMTKASPDYATARDLSDEAVAIAARLPHHEILFSSLLNRGGCEMELGLLEEALKTHQQAYQMAKAQRNHPWMAIALHAIGEDYHHLNNRTEAQRYLDQALLLWKKSGATAQVNALVDFMQQQDYVVKLD